jgi:hypothetical protein
MRKRTRFTPVWGFFAILLMATSFGCSKSEQVEPDEGTVPDTGPPSEDITIWDIHQNFPDLNVGPDEGGEDDAGSEPDTGGAPDIASLLDTDTGGVPVPDEGSVPDTGTTCYDSEDPKVHYVGNSPEECAVIDYDCFSPFAELFGDDCGCGCLDICPDEDSSLVSYASKDPQECMVISLACEEEQTAFSNGCGCGCATICENQSNPKYQYVGHSPEECDLIDFACNNGPQEYFFDACGCGCIDKS